MSTTCSTGRYEAALSWGFLSRAPSRRAPLPATLELAGRTVPVVVAASPRARRLTLRADAAAGAIRVTVPRGVRQAHAMAFIADHQDWLEARVARWPVAVPIAPGETLPFRGAPLMLAWSEEAPRRPYIEGDDLCVGGPLDALGRRVERWLRAEALALLAADCADIAAHIDRPPPPVRVGDPRGRWGSCSASGALAFSWRLVMAPDFVRRAVAAHEVAHLVHHDHGREFHKLCDRLSEGDARRATRWLAANGAALHWVGRA